MRSVLRVLLICFSVVSVFAQTSGFTYQGRLNDGGIAANADYDLQFKLFDALSGGAQQGSTFVLEDVKVVGGTFSVTLDFGAGPFPGAARWLEIAVRPGSSTGSFTVLSPLQAIASVPYAMKSLSADGLSVACVNCVSSSQIATDAVASPAIANGTILDADVSSAAAIAPTKIAGTAATLGANTFTASQSISSGYFSMPNTNAGGTAGVITFGGFRFIHNFGTSNTFVGANAGNLTMSGAANTGFGLNALSSVTTGVNNTSAGTGALRFNTTGSSNSALGTQALFSNTTGFHNTAVGTAALFSSTTSSNNTAIGSEALNSNTSGSSNTATGSGALGTNTTGNDNTAIGSAALSTNTTGNDNTATGAFALVSNLTGSFNTANGYYALGTNSAGGNNTATGYLALTNNLASNNTANGSSALTANTTGSLNTAVGVNALTANTGGISNTAVGVSALTTNTNGFNNTAVGVSALSRNTTGYGNTGIGASALFDIVSGSLNTAIGRDAGPDSNFTGISNSTSIGAQAHADASNKIRLGNDQVTIIEGQVAYTYTSDKTKKENFSPVDAQEVLKRLQGMEVSSWNYIGQDANPIRHYGPMAQDFFAAFGNDGIGTIGTPTTINSGDQAGVLMLAVQALAKRLSDHEARETQLLETVKEQHAQIQQLLAIVGGFNEKSGDHAQ